ADVRGDLLANAAGGPAAAGAGPRPPTLHAPVARADRVRPELRPHLRRRAHRRPPGASRPPPRRRPRPRRPAPRRGGPAPPGGGGGGGSGAAAGGGGAVPGGWGPARGRGQTEDRDDEARGGDDDRAPRLPPRDRAQDGQEDEEDHRRNPEEGAHRGVGARIGD